MTAVLNRETDVRERILVTAERLFRGIGIRRLPSPTSMCGYRVVVATGACEAPFCPLMPRAVESSIFQMFPADYRHREEIPRRARHESGGDGLRSEGRRRYSQNGHAAAMRTCPQDATYAAWGSL